MKVLRVRQVRFPRFKFVPARKWLTTPNRTWIYTPKSELRSIFRNPEAAKLSEYRFHLRRTRRNSTAAFWNYLNASFVLISSFIEKKFAKS